MADKFFEGLWVFILITFFICMVAALGVEFCTNDTAVIAIVAECIKW